MRIILVHGAFHGAWCWEVLLPLFGVEHEVTAVELPLTSLRDDIAAVQAVLDGEDGQAVVVAHSYGGAVLTGLKPDKVGHALYIAALVPDAEDSVVGTVTEQADWMTPDPDGAQIRVAAGRAAGTFYGDCDAVVARRCESRLRPTGIGAFTEAPGRALWREVPTTYLLCTQDRAMAPDVQRGYAARTGNVVEIESSHSPFLSHPSAVADLLTQLASVADRA